MLLNRTEDNGPVPLCTARLLGLPEFSQTYRLTRDIGPAENGTPGQPLGGLPAKSPPRVTRGVEALMAWGPLWNAAWGAPKPWVWRSSVKSWVLHTASPLSSHGPVPQPATSLPSPPFRVLRSPVLPLLSHPLALAPLPSGALPRSSCVFLAPGLWPGRAPSLCTPRY